MAVELILLSRVAHRGREVTGPRLRSLLALLAADLHSGAGTARLVDGLWPDDRPDNPTKALQILVSRARAQLGADVIVTTPTGYRLGLDDEQVDAAAVVAHAAAAARHAHAGAHTASVAAAEAGLALFDGATDPDPGPLADLRTHRRATHQALRRARALALARLDRPAEAVDVLVELARDRPRDEDVLVELLRAEAATVGPAAALARYETYRRALRDELGADPGAAVVAEHRRLLDGEAPAVRRGVAHGPNALLGRDGDVAAVLDLLRSARVTSIVGPGGLGKTRLAHVVSERAPQRGVHVVGLAGVAAAHEVAAEVASALGLGEARRGPSATDVLSGILTALGAGPVLLVLDNCEQVVDGVADLVGALIAMSRDLRVLTTSRAPLGLSSESVYLLPELDLATTVELFTRRARAARPGVDLPGAEVEALCRRLDGLPLAVELAAARIRVLSVGEISRRLDDRFALLRGGARDSPQRHRTLQAVVDWSWNLLDGDARDAWCALALFPGGFTAEAAAYLIGGDALAVLEHLVDQSLLTVVDGPDGTRFRMLETVREFGAARRSGDGALRGLLAWAREFGRAHVDGPFGPDPRPAIERIQAEQDNLTFALRHALARADNPTAVAVAAVLGALWMVVSDFLRLVALVEEIGAVLARFRAGGDDVEVTRAIATLSVGATFMLQGPRATRALLALRRLPAAPPDTVLRAYAVVFGTPGVFGPDPAPLRRLTAAPQPLLAGVAHCADSYLRAHLGDPDGAVRAAQRGVDVFDERHEPWMWLLAHARLVELWMLAGDGGQALTHITAVAPILDAIGAAQAFNVPWVTALAHAQCGDLDSAERALGEAASTQDMDTTTATFDLAVRAELALARDHVPQGLLLWRQAIERLRDTGGLDIDLPGPDPWTLELHATAAVAHARHGRLDLVPDVVTELPHTLAALLDTPVERPPGYVVLHSMWGSLLLAQAMIDLAEPAPGRPDTAARMIACATRLHLPRQFRPTMSAEGIRAAAEQADRPAYEDAMSAYAGLTPEQLRVVALDLLGARV